MTTKRDQSIAREKFRAAVFARDGYRCVVPFCMNGPGGMRYTGFNLGNPNEVGTEGIDAHHLLERRLWADGGYHVDNGVTVCSMCHLQAEATLLSVEQLREWAGIHRVIVPDHLYPDVEYTKWGDVVLPDGTCTPGELFYDESVQNILTAAGTIGRYRRWVKHPRSMHLPWSAGVASDDKIQHDLSKLMDGEVVVTEKLDGEQTTMYRDHIHARSVDGVGHPSRDWVKNLWSQIAYNIPDGWRVCGENMFARHSIAYDNLSSYFFVHSIWDDRNRALDWDDTLEWADLLGLEVVPTLWRGQWDETAVRACWTPAVHDTQEGYVVRSTCMIPLREFPYRVAKFVRPGHVQTTRHWMAGQPIVPNGKAPV